MLPSLSGAPLRFVAGACAFLLPAASWAGCVPNVSYVGSFSDAWTNVSGQYVSASVACAGTERVSGMKVQFKSAPISDGGTVGSYGAVWFDAPGCSWSYSSSFPGSASENCFFTALNATAYKFQAAGSSCFPVPGGWSGWSSCSNSCGDGTQTRSCTNPVPSCGGGCSGSDTQDCTDYSAASYAWKNDSWGACSAVGAGVSGTRARSVWCERTCAGLGATTVADAYCSGAKPAASQGCTNGDWSAFGACSAACGAGTQTRACASPSPLNGGAGCAGLPSKSCTGTSCYTWETGSWGSCSASCGDGTETRSVWCERASDGATVADANCTGTKPDTSDTCSAAAPCTYAWKNGSWSSCSASCGAGTKTRSVWCERSDGVAAADSNCSGTKPLASDSCTGTDCYSWETGSWGSCSGSCSGGTQTRSVLCKRASDGATVASSNCSVLKPTDYQSCWDISACTHSWNKGNWSSCSGGTQTRTAWCERSTHERVDDSYCDAATNPSTSRACSNGTWTAWGACFCEDGSVRPLTYVSKRYCTGDCSAVDGGNDTKSCSSGACSGWGTNSWSSCSSGGTRTRTPVCHSEGIPLSDSSCYAPDRPSASESCTPKNCAASGGCAAASAGSSCTTYSSSSTKYNCDWIKITSTCDDGSWSSTPASFVSCVKE